MRIKKLETEKGQPSCSCMDDHEIIPMSPCSAFEILVISGPVGDKKERLLEIMGICVCLTKHKVITK